MTPIKIMKYLNDFLINLAIEMRKKINDQNNLKYTGKQSIYGSNNLSYRIFL